MKPPLLSYRTLLDFSTNTNSPLLYYDLRNTTISATRRSPQHYDLRNTTISATLRSPQHGFSVFRGGWISIVVCTTTDIAASSTTARAPRPCVFPAWSCHARDMAAATNAKDCPQNVKKNHGIILSFLSQHSFLAHSRREQMQLLHMCETNEELACRICAAHRAVRRDALFPPKVHFR